MTRRAEFSADVKRQAFARSRGICECHRVAGLMPKTFPPQGCGRPLGQGNTFYEHIVCAGIDGDNAIDNCAVLTKTCWRAKTDRFDRKVVSKSKRVRDKARNIRPIRSRPIPGTRRSGIKLPMGGRPIDRTTGREWGSR